MRRGLIDGSGSGKKTVRAGFSGDPEGRPASRYYEAAKGAEDEST